MDVATTITNTAVDVLLGAIFATWLVRGTKAPRRETTAREFRVA
jgi:hypothetical protein